MKNYAKIFKENDEKKYEFPCPLGCSKVYKTNSHLKEHIRRYHPKGEYIENPLEVNQPIKCSSCEETFLAQNFYIQHFQTVHGGFPEEYMDREQFMCDECSGIAWFRHFKKQRICIPTSPIQATLD